MNVAENKAIAERFIKAWNAGGESVIDELAAPNLVVSYTHWPQPARNPEDFKRMLAETHRYFPDLRIAVNEMLAEGDKVMAHWTYTGVHQQGELFGVAPSGKRIQVTGITVYEIKNGKVVAESGIVDALGMMLQVGVALLGA